MKIRACYSVFALLLMIASSAFAGTTPVRGAKGLLTSSSGQTLYTYDEDSSGHSHCTGTCAVLWPPAIAGGGASGDFTVVDRPDGSRQWAYQGKPLYTYVPDQKPGDTLGDGVNGNWHVAK